MRATTYRLILAIMLVGVCFSSIPSGAENLKTRMAERLPVVIELKVKGIIGENNKGYLEFVGGKHEREDVVNAENDDRNKVYTAISQRHGVSVEQVAQRRALQIAAEAKKGEWLQNPDGKWYKK